VQVAVPPGTRPFGVHSSAETCAGAPKLIATTLEVAPKAAVMVAL
jgi:hypothetical protein